MNERPLSILLVEDNPNDVMIAQRALTRGNVNHALSITRDGQDVLDFLFQRGVYAGQAGLLRPDLIFLDLNLPRIDGFEVLRIVKSDSQLRRIPIIVLTTSERDEDITNCYILGANTVISKPLEFNTFLKTIHVINEYWGKIARLPIPPT